jgi:uncharacterized protein (DUF3084 family)
MALELRQMEGEKFDLSIEATFVKDRLKQVQDEKEALIKELDNLNIRFAKATQDYTQILHHREGQIKANEARYDLLVIKATVNCVARVSP